MKSWSDLRGLAQFDLEGDDATVSTKKRACRIRVEIVCWLQSVARWKVHVTKKKEGINIVLC